MDNAALLTAARAIVTARRGERPAAKPMPHYGYSAVAGAAYEARKAEIVAAMDSQSAASAWDRAVRDEFRRLKADASFTAFTVTTDGVRSSMREAA